MNNVRKWDWLLSVPGTVILSVAVQDLPMFKPFDDVTNKNRADSE